MKTTIHFDDAPALRNQLIALAGAHDQTMRCSIIRLMFGAEAKRRKVSETEAFRLWCIDYLSEH